MWGMRPAAEIAPDEISAYIREIARNTPEEARNRLGHLRRCYSWAIGSGGFGLSVNPYSVLKPADLVGSKKKRDRVLTDDEVRAVWAACGGPPGVGALKVARRRDQARDPNAPLGYPYGPLFRLMILTGQRENGENRGVIGARPPTATLLDRNSNALAAARARQTPLTFAFFAVVTGIGGNTLSEPLMGAPVAWVHHPTNIVVCLIVALVVWSTPLRLGGPIAQSTGSMRLESRLTAR
jgi:hypothetical protein